MHSKSCGEFLRDIILFPFGGNAKEAIVAIAAQNQLKATWNLLGFVDGAEQLQGSVSGGVAVVGTPELLCSKYADAQVLAVPGAPKTYQQRDLLIDNLGLSENRWATVIDPSARIAPDAVIGTNTLIMANVMVGPSAKIGNNCVIMSNSVISHDSEVEDYSIVGANVTISGFCHIGPKAYIASGSCLKDHIQIGAEAMVGLGSVVVKNIESHAVVVGNPARALVK